MGSIKRLSDCDPPPSLSVARDGEGPHFHKSLIGLSIGALGVVYGDIGTSPLYALNLMLFGHEGVPLTQDNICGSISLIIWALTIVVAIKYAIFVLRADNDGEGGVFALYALLDKFKKTEMPLLSWALLLGAGLLFGDGIITPAISVLSSVEGLAVETPMFAHFVIPITAAILTALFAFQYKGTGKVGSIFGPILIVWFAVIAFLGLIQIHRYPEILEAFNPRYGIAFLLNGDLRSSLLVLGALMLVLTGGEAMYADMGHFGATPIRISWFTIVFPCIVLNYLGQGAYLLSGTPIMENNVFFSMVPSPALYPMVFLATLATVIASQALISGAFALTSQSIALGLFPRLPTKHTHPGQMGQVYIPFINWAMYIGCVILVITFGSSVALGSAYGLAESGLMITTSTAMFFVARYFWTWGILRSVALFGVLALIDAAFLVANTLKFWDGGYVPLTIGLLVFFIMVTWRWGRKITYAGYSAKHSMSMQELIGRHRASTVFIERTAILMVPAPVHAHSERAPMLIQLLWNLSGILSRNMIFVEVVHPKVPYIHDNRFSVSVIDRSEKGSIICVQVKFGFMEEPNVERLLEEMITHKEIDLPSDRKRWIVHVTIENLIPSHLMSPVRRFRLKCFKILRFISRPTYYHYGLGDEIQLSAEILPIRVR